MRQDLGMHLRQCLEFWLKDYILKVKDSFECWTFTRHKIWNLEVKKKGPEYWVLQLEYKWACSGLWPSAVCILAANCASVLVNARQRVAPSLKGRYSIRAHAWLHTRGLFVEKTAWRSVLTQGEEAMRFRILKRSHCLQSLKEEYRGRRSLAETLWMMFTGDSSRNC